jgi:para-nitrobenzyl esterase
VDSPAVAQSSARSGARAGTGDGDRVVASSSAAVVEIESGKIAGYISDGIYTFKGVPYGETTAAANRFAPPRKVAPWSGVRSSRQYGFVAPQAPRTGWVNDEEAFLFQWNDGTQNEDCLRINAWTPGINDNEKRPVMVWLHGGGFAAGSGHELLSYEGENLARRGDVVVVSLNHRLNVLGFMDLSAYGEQYAQSANVGMLDIVAALEWVRDNIAAFGGDPERVLIFGQSGGGAKVTTLMGMPAAKGLFHRAVVQSGSFTANMTRERSQRLAELVVSALGLGPANIDRLRTLPYEDLRRAGEVALRALNPAPGSVLDVRRVSSDFVFGPSADGKVLPALPFSPAAPEVSADVPVMFGTTLNEFGTSMGFPEYERWTEAEFTARVDELHPGRAEEIVATFRRRTPQANRVDLWSRIVSAPFRQSAIEQAAAKSAQNTAPAYLYWFTWQTPILDGRPRAFHCAELSFVFANTDRCASMTGGGQRARELGARMADAWIQFARTGDPNHPEMPNWSAFSSEAVPTMVFDDETHLALDPDKDERASISTV